MDSDQTGLQHFGINVWIFGVVDHSGYCSHLHCLWKKLFNKELAFFINWKCSSALRAIFRVVLSVAFHKLHFYHLPFYPLAFLPMAFLPFGIFTISIFTIWHFYYWHYYCLAFLLLAFLPSGIFTNDIFTIWHIYQWHFYHLAFSQMAFLPMAILPMAFLPMAFLPTSVFVYWIYDYVDRHIAAPRITMWALVYTWLTMEGNRVHNSYMRCSISIMLWRFFYVPTF